MPDRSLNWNGNDHGAVQRWRETTPRVLQDAIKAGWDGSSTERQKRLLRNWVTARVMDSDIPLADLLEALGERMGPDDAAP